MTLPLDTIICGDNVQVLRTFPDNCIDLTVTSPPYDNLRKYNGYSWDFEAVAHELYRVTKPGGVVVWVVGDATIDGSETGTSFRQALYFRDVVGFKLHDTMIYAKENPVPLNHNRYEQAFEFMFVFSKVRLKTFNGLRVPTKYAGGRRGGSFRHEGTDLQPIHAPGTIKDDKLRTNIWFYSVGAKRSASDAEAHLHPAIFPEALARDHILSWSNPGDVVLDPFCGSGTTCKMARMYGRHYIGIDISEEYCELARRRLRNVQSVLSL